MVIELISGAFLISQFIYHRWKENQKDNEVREIEVSIPRTEEGATIPLLFGTCKVTAPVVAWTYVDGFSSLDDTKLRMLLILGINMNSGNSTTRIKRMWGGDYLMFGPGAVGWGGSYPQTGGGGPETAIDISASGGQGSGSMETLNGNTSQVLVNNGDTSGTAPTYAGRGMLGVMTEDEIAGYRGFASVYLFGLSGNEWVVPPGPVPAYAFEVQTYVDGSGYPGVGIYGVSGPDSNPINVIYDILTAPFGKLGLPTSAIDITSFQAAALKLHQESHGYSRAIQEPMQADELIQSILEQIDGSMDIDSTTGKLVITLVRNDYDPSAADFPHITKHNCRDIVNFTIGSMANTPNKVRVNFTNRDEDYRQDSSVDSSMATAVGQDGATREIVLDFPGVNYRELADFIAARELAARNRHVIKCRALCDRSFAGIRRGQALKLTWSDPDVAGLVFRAANVDRGKLDDNVVAIDLISDVFYSYRGRTPRPLPEPRVSFERFGL